MKILSMILNWVSGDREKREGLEVSPMMDRDLINLCNMQLGFIEFVVAPLIVGELSIRNRVRLHCSYYV